MTTARPDGVPTDAVDISDDGGLCKRILTAGDPAEGTPFEGAEVQVHYVGTLLSDGSKFDSSRDRPGNFKFKIGQGAVIKGWDKGVATMHKGEKAELFCRSDYAYGDAGSPPKIPGGATLKFEVELLSWAEPKKERWEMSASEKLAAARDLKTEVRCVQALPERAFSRKHVPPALPQATSEFKAGAWQLAHDKYTEAVGWVSSEYDFSAAEDKSAAAELHVSCLLNAAQCALKMRDWIAAVKSCGSALALDALPEASKVKALFRRGTAYIQLAEFASARSDLVQACKLDPKSREIREAYASIKEAERAANKADAGLFAKMVKGAGGVRKKPPPGVPADAIDISDDGGLCKRILTAGDPAEGTPFEGAEVQVHYVGTLLSDGSKFDSSRDRPGNFKFKIGQGAVIKGWDKGVATMHKGEKAELFCRSDYAYGDAGSPPKIPGGATLKFEVELLSWAAADAAMEDVAGADEEPKTDDEDLADDE